MSDETVEVVRNRGHATAALCNALRLLRLNVLKCVHNVTAAPIPVAIITRLSARPSPLMAKARNESHIAREPCTNRSHEPVLEGLLITQDQLLCARIVEQWTGIDVE